MADLDRKVLSQYVPETIGLATSVSGSPTDVDDNAITVSITNEDTGHLLVMRPAIRVAQGQYEVQLSPTDTASLGNYTANWSYTLGGEVKTFRSYYAIGGAQPDYDNLPDDMKQIVDSVWSRFADLFDSPNGGPNLATYRQTNWGKGRIAQLLQLGLGRLNTIAQPFNTYSLEPGGKAFPTAQWGSLLEQATFVEALKHLRRSYVEQPEYQGSTVARVDRRDYMQRWGEVLADEEALMRPQLDHFKIKQMGLGRPAVLVSGGIFGRYTAGRLPSMAARPTYWSAGY